MANRRSVLKLVVRWLIAIIALGVTVWIVPGISVDGDGR
jgi:hypothetical protein